MFKQNNIDQCIPKGRAESPWVKGSLIFCGEEGILKSYEKQLVMSKT